MDRICITGAGIVSAIGIGKDETLKSLLDGTTGISKVHHLKTNREEFPVGEVKMTNEEMLRILNISPEKAMPRTVLLSIMAMQEALQQAKLGEEMIPQTGFVSGTTVGGMDKSEQYYHDFLTNDTRNDYIKMHSCGACTDAAADYFGKFAFTTTLSTACSSAANAIIFGADMIRAGKAECVVVGGSECISSFHLNGFATLMILDRQQCRPFDATRAGLNLGEGAAYLVIESEEHAQKRNANILAVLSGYANACDAYHQTASSPEGEGPFLAMTQALKMANIEPDKIDYINAHGTATPNNDASESQAIRRVFGEKYPPTSSTKSFTGHTTSASGSIETVISLLAMQNGILPANINYGTPDPECVNPITENKHIADIQHVMCNSFGFGGNDSSLIISKPGFDKGTDHALDEKPIYICSAKQISAQCGLTDDWFENPVTLTEQYVRSADPDFKPYVTPQESRRMGRILKRAVATAKEALKSAQIEAPDAIVTGTGLGCIENTEFFLEALLSDGKETLKPTHFMNSTHNTISSLIGIMTQTHGYNATFSHEELSFDSALLNACLLLHNNEAASVLVQGHDELTPNYHTLLKRAGIVGRDTEIASEVSVAMLVTNHPKTTPMCRIAGMAFANNDEVENQLSLLLKKANLTKSDIDAVMTDVSGDKQNDEQCMTLCQKVLNGTPVLRYKHLFGNNFTASSLGCYALACCLQKGSIPETLYLDKKNSVAQPKVMLMLHHTAEGHNSLILLTKD